MNRPDPRDVLLGKNLIGAGQALDSFANEDSGPNSFEWISDNFYTSITPEEIFQMIPRQRFASEQHLGEVLKSVMWKQKDRIPLNMLNSPEYLINYAIQNGLVSFDGSELILV